MKLSSKLLLNGFVLLGGLALVSPVQANAASSNQSTVGIVGTNSDSTETLAEAQKAVDVAKSNLDKATQTVKDAQTKVDSASKNPASNSDITKEQGIVDAANSKVQSLTATVASDQQKLSKATSDSQVASNQYQTLKSQITSLNASINNLKKANSDNTTKLSNNANRQKALEQATNQLKEAQAKLADNQAAQTSAKEALQKAKDQLASDQQSATNAQKDLLAKQQIVQKDSDALDTANQALAALQAQAGETDTNKITLPTGLTTDWMKKASDNYDHGATYELDDVPAAGMTLNHYDPLASDKNIQIADPAKLSAEVQTQLTLFVENLLNPLREQLGEQPLTATSGAMDFVNEIVSGYNSENNGQGWSIVRGHDVNVIEAAAGDFGLANDNNYYESAAGTSITAGKTTLADLKTQVFDAILRLLFDDKESKYGHLIGLIGSSKYVADQNYENEMFGFGIDKLGQLHFEIVPINTSTVGQGYNAYVKDYDQAIKKLGVGGPALAAPTVDPAKIAAAKNTAQQAQTTLTSAKANEQTAEKAVSDANTKKSDDQKIVDAQNTKLAGMVSQAKALANDIATAKKTISGLAKPLSQDEIKQLNNENKNNSTTLKSETASLQKVQSKASAAQKVVASTSNALTVAKKQLTDDQNALANAKTDAVNQQTKLTAMKQGKSEFDIANQALKQAQANEVTAQKAFDDATATLNRIKNSGGGSDHHDNQPNNSSNGGSTTPATTVTVPSQSTNSPSTPAGPVTGSSSTNQQATEQHAAATFAPFNIYGKRTVYRYSSPDFSKANRLAKYVKKPMMVAPVFKVIGVTKSDQNRLRYRLSDGSYMTTSDKYVDNLYQARLNRQKVYVIAKSGINGYQSKRLTKGSNSAHYNQGHQLMVKKVVRVGTTVRYLLTNGNYISASKKLVSTRKAAIPTRIRTRKAIKRYRNVNLTQAGKKIPKNTILKVYGWDYSYGNNHYRQSILRYRVSGGYVTSNSKYVVGK